MRKSENKATAYSNGLTKLPLQEAMLVSQEQ
jgi:hypothetical protein